MVEIQKYKLQNQAKTETSKVSEDERERTVYYPRFQPRLGKVFQAVKAFIKKICIFGSFKDFGIFCDLITCSIKLKFS